MSKTETAAADMKTKKVVLLDGKCVICGTAAGFQCIHHCQGTFCIRCTCKHRDEVRRTMRRLFKRLTKFLEAFFDLAKANYFTDPNETLKIQSTLELYKSLVKENVDKDKLMDESRLVEITEYIDELEKRITAKTSLVATANHLNRSEQTGTCSLCGAVAIFKCIDHCKDDFCTQCICKHRTDVIRRMCRLFKRLKTLETKTMELITMSTINFAEKSDGFTQANSFTDSHLSLQTKSSSDVYMDTLREYLDKDKLLDEHQLVEITEHLHVLTKKDTVQTPSDTVSSDLNKSSLLMHRSRLRAQTATISKTISVSLNVKKTLPLAIERSFSVGQHPIVVSLVDTYLETFFCQGRDNTVVLLSLTSIDVYSRSSALTWSIPLSRVLGTSQDKIFAGVWCSHAERLILVGRYLFYVFDLNRERIRCVCKCGCGARSISGTLRPKHHRALTQKYRCPPTFEDRSDTRRFLATNHSGTLYYAYKSGPETYRLEARLISRSLSDIVKEREKLSLSLDDSNCQTTQPEFELVKYLTIDAHLAAMDVSNCNVAFVYRRFPQKETSQLNTEDLCSIDHYFALHSHSLNQIGNHVRLPSSIRWITSVVSYRTGCDYLLCDPRSQQILVYQATNDVFIRRFHIGPINVCCLSNGRLALWIQKAYPSSPIGKLHFISTPHLEKYATVSKSMELLKSPRK